MTPRMRGILKISYLANKHLATQYYKMGAELPTDMKQGHGGEARITHHPERSGERERRRTLWCNGMEMTSSSINKSYAAFVLDMIHHFCNSLLNSK